MATDLCGVLPWQFRFPHRYAQGLHDRLVGIARHLQDEQFWEVEFQFRSVADAEAFSAVPDADVRQWLEEHDYADVIGELLMKQFVFALIEDFVHFLYEALRSCAEGRTVVTWALLRKPFTDALSQLEWIVADPDEFLTSYYNLTPSQFEGRIREKKHAQPRIAKALSLLPSGVDFDAEFLYDLRYGSRDKDGLAKIANRALHLVTIKQDHTPRSVNFIFSGGDARRDDWKLIYSWLPIMLFYAAEVCEVAAAYCTRALLPDAEFARLRRGVGFVLWGVARKRFEGELPPRSEAMVEVDVDLCCKHCGYRYQTELALERLYFGHRVQCRQCRVPHRLSDFVDMGL
jgi:hypothetical protein